MVRLAASMTQYKRHGTVDLFTAMNVATGQVLTALRNSSLGRMTARGRFRRFLDFAFVLTACSSWLLPDTTTLEPALRRTRAA